MSHLTSAVNCYACIVHAAKAIKRQPPTKTMPLQATDQTLSGDQKKNPQNQSRRRRRGWVRTRGLNQSTFHTPPQPRHSAISALGPLTGMAFSMLRLHPFAGGTFHIRRLHFCNFASTLSGDSSAQVFAFIVFGKPFQTKILGGSFNPRNKY